MKDFFSSSSAIQTVNLNVGERREAVCGYSSLVPITALCAAVKAVRERRDSCVLNLSAKNRRAAVFSLDLRRSKEQIHITQFGRRLKQT